ncbi:RasGEF domain containing protein [Histomonas meleagridis]|uniref:RasGEF domain containing protein n=1 Tax=Histomonas meleagridis TaxID=135588 RepID=UPI003559E190|nr:RasGEF domain containing protein [Histomonas meleagridis]KAH0798725.1 RasGEF domain containing protein [Histomonas meleagridis]
MQRSPTESAFFDHDHPLNFRTKRGTINFNNKTGIPINPLKTKDIERETFLKQLYEELGLTPDELNLVKEVNFAVPKDPKEYVINPETGKISAASIVQLFLVLTDPDTGLDFQRQFLQTFVCYMRPQLLLSMLITRYTVPLNVPDINITSANSLNQIQIRIIRVLSSWLNMSTLHFKDDNMVTGLLKFSAFIRDETLDEAHQSNQYKIVTSEINRFTGSGSKPVVTKREMPDPILPRIKEDKWTSIQIFNPEEVSRQFTLLHSDLFRRIEPNELLEAIWFDNKQGTHKLNELIRMFDIFSGYVSLTVLNGANSRERAHVYKYWVDVATEFEKIHNYHGLFSVCCGLNHASVKRLYKTMKVIGKTKPQKKALMDKLFQICDFSDDYGAYRAIIAKAVEPCVPFIGCFQKDLKYVQETYPNRIEGLINFKKCVECYALLKTIQRFQNIGYYYIPVPKLQKLILDLQEPPSTTELMKISLSKEKKKNG